tara:strand:- start:328 stop:807 length:480 start_codon:yes stop_codon:yes gene_type:complete
MKKKIEIGDIFELETKMGKYIYIQCVNIPEDSINDIELTRVFYDLYNEKQIDLEKVTSKDFFYNKFPLSSALRKKILQRRGNINLPQNYKLPLYYRTENPFGDGWQIVNSVTLKRENVLQLTEEQKKLSPWGFMNDTLIIELLEAGWNLENWDLENRSL